MAKITIAVGGLLFILGIVAFALTGSEHPTALIPAGFGVVFELLGMLALNPKIRRHAMHAAAALGVLGFAGTVPGVIKLIRWGGGTVPERPAAVQAQAIMAGLMLVFVGLCVLSFINARRNRQAAEQLPANPSS